MTNLEYGIENGLIEWHLNELMDYTGLTIKQVYPKDTAELLEALKFLVSEVKSDDD